MLFRNNKNKDNKKDITPIENKDYIECPICSARLTNPESMLAGIGPVCNKKQRFAESLKRQDLKSLANKRKNLKELKINSTVILKDKEDSFFLGTILSKDENQLVYLDLTSFNELLINNRGITNSFLDSINKEFIQNLEYYSIVDKPSSPDIKRKYNKFIRSYKKIIEEREILEKDILERGINQGYVVVNNKNSMTDRQKFNRRLLMELKTDNSTEYDKLWNKGHVQLNTFLSRIKENETLESQKIFEFLYEKQKIFNKEENIKIKDSGLTEQEILNGLKHSHRKEDYLAAKAFIKGSRHVLLILATLKKLDSIKDPKVRMILYKEINSMITRKKYTKEDLKKALL